MGLIDQLPYVHALGDGGPRATTQVVVLHATDNTASASNEAAYASHRPDKTSAHLYVDTGACIRALPLDHIAYGCLWHGNQISVQIEMVGRSNAIPDATMRRAAECVAEICQRYGIPVRKISAAQVAAGVKGIVGHADITAAFPQDRGDHTDPGSAFPWNTFIGYVQAAAGGKPTPTPTPAPEDDMPQDLIDSLRAFLQNYDGNRFMGGSSWISIVAEKGIWGDTKIIRQQLTDLSGKVGQVTVSDTQAAAIGDKVAAAANARLDKIETQMARLLAALGSVDNAPST